MKNQIWRTLLASIVTVLISVSVVNAQSTDPAKQEAIKTHTAVATAAAKDDFKGSLNMCTPPTPAPAAGQRGARGGGQQNPQAGTNSPVEAAKAFDNLYFV